MSASLLPSFLPLYVEDPFDSVHIQRPLLPPDIYNLAVAAVLHIFPWAANVFPREIHWQGNCMKADRPTDRANTLAVVAVGAGGARRGAALH